MTYTVIDHGKWERYRPDPLPAWANNVPVDFARRETDGIDFYEFRKVPEQFYENSLVATTLFFPETGLEIVLGAFRDETLPVPTGMRFIEILGVDPKDPAPHKLFEQKVYDPVTRTFSAQPAPPVSRVSASQAKIQLSRMPGPGGVDMLTATENLVNKSGDRELQLWFREAQWWRIASANVRKVGGAFRMKPDEIKTAFEAASLIDE